MILLFRFIVAMEDLFGLDPRMSDWMEYKNYRKARGGHWGRWGVGHNLTMWYPTCEHFADPVPGIKLLEKESH
ncbi:hypothetical protein EBT16_07240 [bacterium]|nr:hypothetical protein [bacterium]